VRAVLVPAPGAPPAAEVAAALAREGIDIALDATAADRPVALVWLPADPDAGALAAALRGLPPRLVLGCAPEAQPAVGERALAAGFDDFVAGRAPARELAARLRVIARHATREPGRPRELLRHGRIALDSARHELWVDDRRVPLTTLEVAVLATLILARGRALSRAELLDRVWGADDFDVGPRAVDNLVLRLRRKIGDDLIVTVRGLGFRI
jgi:hypothetical protein